MLRLLLTPWVLLFAHYSQAVIEVTDDAGHNIRLSQPAQRIISLAPNITEILFHIGAGKQIVGADEYSNYPPAAKDITRVNNHATANYELILSLQPDLVIAWQSGNGETVIRRIRELGIPIFLVETRRLDDIPNLYMQLGQLTGHGDYAEGKADDFAKKLHHLRVSNQAKPAVKAFYQVWSDPLITLNGEHIVSDIIELCGGKNIFHQALPLVPYVNIESILAADPQVIIAGGGVQERQMQIAKWQQWPSISAVSDKHIYTIPADLMQRHSERILAGAEMMCRHFDHARLKSTGK
jgi:iron complex transport system substrate-binding protein